MKATLFSVSQVVEEGFTHLTPEGAIEYAARVSNPENQAKMERGEMSVGGLLRFCMREGHVSVFEQATATVRMVDVPRTIGRQLLRHNIKPQEFSQRYAKVQAFLPGQRARRQDPKNRQASIDDLDEETIQWWEDTKHSAATWTETMYKQALVSGIAKEIARDILPEGLTPSNVFGQANMRDWFFYLRTRLGNGTQEQHCALARMIREALTPTFPVLMGMLDD